MVTISTTLTQAFNSFNCRREVFILLRIHLIASYVFYLQYFNFITVRGTTVQPEKCSGWNLKLSNKQNFDDSDRKNQNIITHPSQLTDISILASVVDLQIHGLQDQNIVMVEICLKQIISLTAFSIII